VGGFSLYRTGSPMAKDVVVVQPVIQSLRSDRQQIHDNGGHKCLADIGPCFVQDAQR
jgi:hypothetical protein